MTINKINYEITLYNSPYYDNLIQDLIQVNRQKKNILKRIKSEEDYQNLLDFEERKFLQYLSKKEGDLLKEIMTLKQAFNYENTTGNNWKISPEKNDDFDIYRVNPF